MKNKNRWYDEIPELADFLEKIKEKDRTERDKVFVDIKNIIVGLDPELIDKHAMEFPLDLKRRWYDKDPISWMIINVLKYADEELIEKVIIYCKERFEKAFETE